ncbi:PQQ-dependent sugar dehydrogenase [Bdellovibrio sp. HCB2-146]|uniref:PQQ-dependent sugar dehydrogenase n=1 Tax=Bdellovibrio sp. HCB2-146 TaxID=3394362 RepID=UPI0039BCB11D
MRILLFLLSITLVQCSLFSSKSPRRETAATRLVLDKSGYQYDPQDRSCDGFPRVQVETMPGTCLGMVLPRDRALDVETQKGFIKPRTILQLGTSKQFLVVDMGGWSPQNGRLFLLKPSVSGAYEIKLIKAALENPHGLALGPDGFYYIGERTRISKFHFVDGKIQDWQLVIGDLPRKEGYMHPLSQFVFDPRNGDLYINSGSPSDHCVVAGTGAYKACPEEAAQGNGAIYRIPGEKLKNIPKGGLKYYEVAAMGLRNSMAMAVSDAGFLIQGENSRDFPELEEPYEEINVIDLDYGRGFHYGWPYCYDFHATSPEWLFPENKNLPLHKQFSKPVNCAQVNPQAPGEYQAPWLLMPPHVAPLHMAYYKGQMFGDILGGKLLVTWHGYQPSGQRLVAYTVDEKGRPLAKESNSVFNFNQAGGCPTQKSFQPHGGMDRHGSYLEVISKWNEVKGVRPKGAPVAFTEAQDGSLWIVEDRENRTILRLARTQTANYRENCDRRANDAIDPQVTLLAWRSLVKDNPILDEGYRRVQSELIQKHCTGCHGNLQAQDIAQDRFSQLDFVVKNEWIVAKNLEKSKMYGAVARVEGYTPMPPADKEQFFGTSEGERLNKILADWIQSIPDDVAESYSRVKMTDKRNVRQQAGTAAKVCGQVQSGDVVYVDPRPAKVITKDGYQWKRIYLVPAHSRLFKETCVAPEDGVYYIVL